MWQQRLWAGRNELVVALNAPKARAVCWTALSDSPLLFGVHHMEGDGQPTAERQRIGAEMGTQALTGYQVQCIRQALRRLD